RERGGDERGALLPRSSPDPREGPSPEARGCGEASRGWFSGPPTVARQRGWCSLGAQNVDRRVRRPTSAPASMSPSCSARRSPHRSSLASSAPWGRPWARWLLLFALAGSALPGCGRAESPRDGVTLLRERGAESDEAEVVAEWLLAELIAPDGQAEQAQRARARLDRLGGKGMLSHFARALDDAAHGRPDRAADEFVGALLAARSSQDPRAPLLAWFAAQQANDHRSSWPGFGERWHEALEGLLDQPGNIGWRAYGVVVDLWSAHAWSKARADLNDEIARKLGCLTAVRVAGPFGDDNPADIDRDFAAEAPGPWPQRWEPRPG